MRYPVIVDQVAFVSASDGATTIHHLPRKDLNFAVEAPSTKRAARLVKEKLRAEHPGMNILSVGPGHNPDTGDVYMAARVSPERPDIVRLTPMARLHRGA